MIWRFLFSFLFVAHLILLPSLVNHMQRRPVAVKLGYLPHPIVMRMASADHVLLAAEAAVIKVLFYFGTIAEKFSENVIVRTEHVNMYQTLRTAIDLDPRNQDAYYFAQAAFTWEAGWVREVNDLLERSYKYRPWDAQVPFFLGFNYGYFLKDYDRAAAYMQRAAEISGNNLYAGLASRYYYESRKTELGLLFLDRMIQTSKNDSIRKSYKMRRAALQSIAILEKAVSAFKEKTGSAPKVLDDLFAQGVLKQMPVDPYGGRFYIDDQGRIRTTSALAKASN